MSISNDSRDTARSAGLHYASDLQAGIVRYGSPGRFRYRMATGKPVKDRSVLKRIKSLAIPPAWKEVWIASRPDSHLQATGRDARGRKQYRYHQTFAAHRDSAKYAHLVEFAQSLPALRRQLKKDLALPGLPQRKILAAIVTLLEETLIRVGNEDYARNNKSFGLTTLRNRHVKVRGGEMRFLFRGKSGKEWSLSLRNRRVAKVIRSCQDLPGQHLFEYRDADGAIRALSSSEVNAYLREVTGRDITAKDFRTWAGTVKAAKAFANHAGAPDKSAVRQVVAAVADELGNTVAICRKCYIHPAILAGFESGSLALKPGHKGRDGLAPWEIVVLRYLRRHR
jgi:DNA topoisomerase-1